MGTRSVFEPIGHLVKVSPVPKLWAGATCFILGGGPSLAGVELERLRGRRIIVINRTFRLAPWAHVLYFCDHKWWAQDGADVLSRFNSRGLIFSVSNQRHDRIHNLRNTGRDGLELDPRGLRHGTNSGFQAINLAYHLGVRRIVLLGYDMQVSAAGATHAHGGYGMGAAQVQHILQRRMLPYFDSLVSPLGAAGVEIINATEGSALECFHRRPLSEVLESLPPEPPNESLGSGSASHNSSGVSRPARHGAHHQSD